MSGAAPRLSSDLSEKENSCDRRALRQMALAADTS
jgi:hypothetical protein